MAAGLRKREMRTGGVEVRAEYARKFGSAPIVLVGLVCALICADVEVGGMQ